MTGINFKKNVKVWKMMYLWKSSWSKYGLQKLKYASACEPSYRHTNSTQCLLIFVIKLLYHSMKIRNIWVCLIWTKSEAQGYLNLFLIDKGYSWLFNYGSSFISCSIENCFLENTNVLFNLSLLNITKYLYH